MKIYEQNNYWNELKILINLAIPLILACGLQASYSLIDVIFIGHLGQQELAIGTLSGTIFNLFWYFNEGATTSYDTMASASFGASDMLALDYWTKQSLILYTLVSLPACFLIWNGGIIINLFLSHGNEAENADDLSEKAQLFCQFLTPGFLFLLWSTLLQKKLQSQNIVSPTLYIALCGNILNAFFNWLFIFYLDFGLNGSAIGTTLTRFLIFIFSWIIVIYYDDSKRRLIHLNNKRKHLHVWLPGENIDFDELSINYNNDHQIKDIDDYESSDLIEHIHHSKHQKLEFVKLSIYSGFALAIEAWSFDITTVLASLLGTIQIDAHSILLLFSGFTFLMFGYSLGQTSCIRIGNLLGAKRAHQAKLSGRLCVLLSGVLMFFSALCCIIFRYKIAKLFTNDIDVINKVSQLMPIVALFQVADGVQGVLSGTLRGQGKQLTVVKVALIVLPLSTGIGAWLTFYGNFGLSGLWTGFIIGLTLLSILYSYVFSKTDWELESRKALDRITRDRKESKDLWALDEFSPNFSYIDKKKYNNDNNDINEETSLNNKKKKKKFKGDYQSI